MIAGSFGGVNLEDIAPPGALRSERKLKERLRHPHFPRRPARHRHRGGGRPHQRPQARRARSIEDVHARCSPAPARRAPPCIKLLMEDGPAPRRPLRHRTGALVPRPSRPTTPDQAQLADMSQPTVRGGSGRGPGGRRRCSWACPPPAWSPATWCSTMAQDAHPLRHAPTPCPRSMPEEALAAGAAVVGTGRSDFPNQINNVLAFPGDFPRAPWTCGPGTSTMR